MDDVKRMFRTIVNGQSAIKTEILTKIDKLDKKLSGRVDSLDNKIDGVEKRLTKRINKLGRQIAYIEDDAPTIEEFDKLEKRVTSLETSSVKN